MPEANDKKLIPIDKALNSYVEASAADKEETMHLFLDFLEKQEKSSIKTLQIEQNKNLPLLAIITFAILVVWDGLTQPLRVGDFFIPTIDISHFIIVTTFFFLVAISSILISNGEQVCNCIQKVVDKFCIAKT